MRASEVAGSERRSRRSSSVSYLQRNSKAEAKRSSRGRGSVFADFVGTASGSASKTRLFGALLTPGSGLLAGATRHVTSLYHREGFFQLLAQNKHFGHITLVVICVNAIYMGVEADHNAEGKPLHDHMVFKAMDHGFCAFFLFEIIVRFGAFANKLDALKDNWFKFDTCLVSLMVFETWIQPNVMGSGESAPGMGPFRLLRLMRLARMTRLLRSVPELWTLTKGMRAAARAVSATLVLLVCIIYIFAIAFRGLASAEELEENFGSLVKCMWVLLMTGTFMDNIEGILTELLDHQPILVIIFLLFVLLSALTVMNMLIGVLCEVVSAVARAEQEADAMSEVQSTLTSALTDLDADRDGMLNRDEVFSLLDHPGCLATLTNIGICTEFVIDYMDILFKDNEDAEISTRALAELMWHWQTTATITVQTIVEHTEIISGKVGKNRQQTMSKIENLESQHNHLKKRISGVSSHLAELRQQVGFLVTEMKGQLQLPPPQQQSQPQQQLVEHAVPEASNTASLQSPLRSVAARAESPTRLETPSRPRSESPPRLDVSQSKDRVPDHGGCGDAAAGEGQPEPKALPLASAPAPVVAPQPQQTQQTQPPPQTQQGQPLGL